MNKRQAKKRKKKSMQKVLNGRKYVLIDEFPSLSISQNIIEQTRVPIDELVSVLEKTDENNLVPALVLLASQKHNEDEELIFCEKV